MRFATKLISIMVSLLFVFHLAETARLIPLNFRTVEYNLTDSVINAKLSALAYCKNGCVEKQNCLTSKQLNIKDPVHLFSNLTQVIGFVGYRSDTKSIVVSLRGSSNVPNWWQDFNIEMRPYSKCKDCYIHEGFYFDYNIMSTKIYENIDKLLSKYEVKRLVTTGHSLGGAIGLIAGLQIKLKYGTKFSVEVHNFGQPRVGDANLAQFMKNKINAIFRVVHNRDIVPHVPFSEWKYKHPATQIFFTQDMKSYKICNETGQDPNCSNKFFPEYTASDHQFYFIGIDSKQDCKLTQFE